LNILNGFGKLLVKKCIEHAKEMNCYKIILNCNENNMIFYEKQGFQKKENQMALYF
jgi:glucosamine-phosphate N-acetyltransferase